MEGNELHVTLDPQDSALLARLAGDAGVPEDELARSLLSGALQDAGPGGRGVTHVLDAIPGAWERAVRGLAQARDGRTVALEDL